MRFESHEPARFGRSSPVLKHWLAHSEGFRVEGSFGSGVIEQVYGVPGAARTVAVRRRFGRGRLLLPAEAFDEVVPADRLLIVGGVPREERRPRRTAARARRTGAQARRLSTRCGRWVGGTGRALGRASARAGTVAVSILRDAALSLVELERAARPRARRLVSAFAGLLTRGIARSFRAIAQQAATARREARVAESLEKVIVALGRERAAENGRVSEERPRELTGTGGRRRRAQ